MPRFSGFLSLSSFKLVSGCLLFACTLYAARGTIHWPLAGDASIMHYVAFLIGHGKKPYLEFQDINMPGAWIVDYAVMHTMGGGALAWRLFDLLLLGLATLAMISIASPTSRFAGGFAGLTFALVHIQDGIYEIGERDLTVAVLILLSCAAFFRATRRKSAGSMIVFGLLAGFAAAIKPTFIVFAPSMLVLFLLQRKRANLPFVLGFAGCVAIPVAIAVYLWRIGALGAFVSVVRGIDMYHAGLAHRPVSYLLLHSVSPLMVVVVLWVFLLPGQIRHWATWEGLALAAGLFIGLMSYLVQGKGYSYQRYPFLALLLLMMAFDFARGMRESGAVRIVALAAIAYTCFVLAPVSVLKATSYDWKNQEFASMLQHDLTEVGGSSLSGHVQCIDTIAGCYNVLYNMKLMPGTGFLYDEFIFGPASNPVIATTRAEFLSAIQNNPPRVFVVTDKLFPAGPDDFAKLAMWPDFNNFLQRKYRVCATGRPRSTVRWWNRSEPPNSYRLFCLVQ